MDPIPNRHCLLARENAIFFFKYSSYGNDILPFENNLRDGTKRKKSRKTNTQEKKEKLRKTERERKTETFRNTETEKKAWTEKE